MKRIAPEPVSTMVSLSRGLYARVARRLGVHASYISRIARGKRRSKVVEKALSREFDKVLLLIRNSSVPSDKSRRTQTRK